jgi:diguanylate cyclase (GGDEF)-like protein
MKFAIICVDDDPIVLASLGEQLGRSLGSEHVELASGALEALFLVAELQAEGIAVPAIICDRQMPEMSGEELLTQIHLKYPQILTILLTGQSSLEDVAKAVNSANLYRYITKPWDETDLLLTIKEAVRSYFQAQEIIAQTKSLTEAHHQLTVSVSLLQATLESTADGILVVNSEGHVTHYNQKLRYIWGLHQDTGSIGSASLKDLSARQKTNPKAAELGIYTDDWMLTAMIDLLQDPTIFATKIGTWEGSSSRESYHLLTLKNGKIIECYGQSQCVEEETVGRVWSFHDITDQRVSEEIIHYQATYDYLTGLLNRNQIEDKLSELLADASLDKKSLAVLFIDLDRFKAINDTLGHVIGDGLLQQVVPRLQQCCCPNDLLARWGGDVFIMVLPQISSQQSVSEIADRIHKSLQPSFTLEEHSIDITCSIGIGIFPEDGRDPVSLFKNVNTALSKAKKQGGNDYQFYTAELRE